MDGCAAMRGWTGESVWMNRRLGAGEWAIRGIGISSLKDHIAIIFISYFKSQIIFQIYHISNLRLYFKFQVKISEPCCTVDLGDIIAIASLPFDYVGIMAIASLSLDPVDIIPLIMWALWSSTHFLWIMVIASSSFEFGNLIVVALLSLEYGHHMKFDKATIWNLNMATI